ncbi:MAG: glycosyltransferase [Mesorhizobium sp.]|nr:glycosyltransferase [bacterium M00.F.Ca.ET.205.01.1.1]TGU51003.1 glycosyltransferase [bacterium M00.F.Ca.ET.152.01.1.1]TGV34492.1 glycosyltransferase [Mesorhizobium sp. M00.F.Ca.ET.186.01.1.1]TGZ41839.1 glycosyltransferase [bacterium M00.F.Ca.ET.162.01.1.1]TIW62615.1 MAG: glycosyltransferase [Mesorhizobium sp.]
MYENDPDRISLDPRISIVICTDGRAEALANNLHCLQFLDGPEYEVCVVRGPTEDGIAEVLAKWEGRIKVASNPERNLSASRNLGIALAAGDIVAFVDDDGMPEQQWLVDLLPAFDDPQVAAAGGIVMDHTGAREQYLYSSADRLGNADWQRKTPADEYNFPGSYNFPYLQGTNAAFRRDVLVALGGFDEEYEFYLDETDLCCRINDAGWKIRQLPNAAVHHKFLPSAIRSPDRVTRVRYPVLKNKLYFSLVNNRNHYSVKRAVEDMLFFVRGQEADVRYHVETSRLLSQMDLDVFSVDEERAWEVGLKRGLSNSRRLMAPILPSRPASSFLPFARLTPSGGRNTFVFLSQEYPPGPVGGVGRYINQLARAVAAIGHNVHVLTRGHEHDRVDFEDGVWVHRVVSRQSSEMQPEEGTIPAHIWTHSALMLEELRRLAQRQQVDAVYAPIWDCEGAAILLDDCFPLVTGLQTTLHFWLESHDHHRDDLQFMEGFAKPMLALEARLLRDSAGIHAISKAIRRDISRVYDVALEDGRTAMVPLGLEDFSALPDVPPAPLPQGTLRVVFIGRLERRKGIDVLLDVIPSLLARYPDLHFDIVGNDNIPGPDGKTTYRAAFEAATPTARMTFHGEVSEEQLRGFYRACDIFVAPSRFESFGQVLVEAMIYGKPVIACRAGGMVEIVEPEYTGLLAEPGDSVSLERCLERLVAEVLLRRSFGEAGRRRYEQRFSVEAAAHGVVALLRQASRATTD